MFSTFFIRLFYFIYHPFFIDEGNKQTSASSTDFQEGTHFQDIEIYKGAYNL